MDSLAVRDLLKQDDSLYKKWFQYADLDCDGRISGAEAVRFFSHSKLSKEELKKVWALADSKRQGYLGYQEFIVAMQCISLVQTGNSPSVDTLINEAESKNISPPTMEGLEEIQSADDTFKEIDGDMMVTLPPRVPPTLLSRLLPQKPVKKNPVIQVKQFRVATLFDGLHKLYMEKLRPLEVAYQFNDFGFPLLTANNLVAKPMVMLLGQYSTGKTTFIKHLLNTEYPGAHIGPEPTTDSFTVIMGGPDNRIIPGNTVAMETNLPFTGITKFGSGFLSKFECAQMHHPLLEEISLVDTPGILSGEKQQTSRNYDFSGVTEWFAAKCDLILLLFDPYKLDISDELKHVILSLCGHEEKIRIILNKADQVSTMQLMRVYGALMWSLGKIFKTPEVFRVYVGSFNDKSIKEHQVKSIRKELLKAEHDKLLADLKDIPRMSCDRMINEFVKRARSAKVHSYLMDHMKKEMPSIVSKRKAQQRLIDNLEEEFRKVQKHYDLSVGDMPNVDYYKEMLSRCNVEKFEKLKPELIQAVDEVLTNDIPNLIRKFRNPYEQ